MWVPSARKKETKGGKKKMPTYAICATGGHCDTTGKGKKGGRRGGERAAIRSNLLQLRKYGA